MLGAIIGDIAGSRFEWHNIKTKEFELLTHRCHFTDDTVMSLAVCDALMNCGPDRAVLSGMVTERMREYGRKYPHAGYGGRFQSWSYDDDPQPYNSFEGDLSDYIRNGG